MNKWLYLSLDVGSILVPFLFSFHPKLQFNKQFRFAFPAIVITAALFVVWDIAMTKLGVWGFNNDYVTGIYVYNLPLEEVLFFICIPFACLFTYHCLKILIPAVYHSDPNSSGEESQPPRFLTAFGMTNRRSASTLLSILLIVATVTVAVFNTDKIYTVSTFLSLAFVITLLQFVLRVKWLGHFYLSFLVLLIPFFIVNGILTGTGLSQPVVWYNDHENLGLRVMTIPIEDTFYGMLFQLTNVALFEAMRKSYVT